MKNILFLAFVSLTFLIISCSDVSVKPDKDESDDSDASGIVEVPDKNDNNSGNNMACLSNHDCYEGFLCIDGFCSESRSGTGNFAQSVCQKFCDLEINCSDEKIDDEDIGEFMAECMIHCPAEIEEELQFAEEISKDCRSSYESLLKCVSSLNCEDFEKHIEGEPFEDLYPCDKDEEKTISACEKYEEEYEEEDEEYEEGECITTLDCPDGQICVDKECVNE
jgi:hypothetical protein